MSRWSDVMFQIEMKLDVIRKVSHQIFFVIFNLSWNSDSKNWNIFICVMKYEIFLLFYALTLWFFSSSLYHCSVTTDWTADSYVPHLELVLIWWFICRCYIQMNNWNLPPYLYYSSFMALFNSLPTAQPQTSLGLQMLGMAVLQKTHRHVGWEA